MIPWFCDNCIVLKGDEILHKFRSGEVFDKTFSKLYAIHLGIQTLPGIVLEIRNKQVVASYYITPDSEGFLEQFDSFIVLYDFRIHFSHLEKWMKDKKMRPQTIDCDRDNLENQIEESLKKGMDFTDNFFIIATPFFPDHPFVLSTLHKSTAYIEYSDNYGVSHGSSSTKFYTVQSEHVGKKDSLNGWVYPVVDATRAFTSLVGVNTTCEFLLIDDIPYLVTAQKRSSTTTGIPLNQKDMKIISPGSIQGKIVKVDQSLDITTLSEDQKYVFLAEKPYSEFVDLIKYAEGFIFNEGSMLCHLAILLREKGIPARIEKGSMLTYRDGDTIMLE